MVAAIKRRLASAGALGFALSAPAAYAASAFDLPGEAFWGGWDRGDPGTLFAEWRVFEPVDDNRSAGPDLTPDENANTGTTLLQPEDESAFITGGNIYSFAGVQEFFVFVGPADDPPAPLNVALQVATRGETLDPDSVKLNQTAWDERRVLEAVVLDPEDDEARFGGDDLTEVYVWYGVDVNTAFTFNLTAAGTSLSLAALAVDVGPAGEEPPPPPAPAATENVPLPAPALALAAGIVAATGARRHGGQAGR